MPILAVHSLTRSLQSTGKRGFQEWTDSSTVARHYDTVPKKHGTTLLCYYGFGATVAQHYNTVPKKHGTTLLCHYDFGARAARHRWPGEKSTYTNSPGNLCPGNCAVSTIRRYSPADRGLSCFY